MLARALGARALMLAARSVESSSNPFDEAFVLFLLLLVPVVLPMTKLGVVAFKKMSDMNFKNITLGVLAFSGGGLVYKSASVGLVLLTALPLLK